MSLFIGPEACFNVPISAFNSGSYFGDTDILLQRQGARSHTAVCQTNCQLYGFEISQMKEILDKFAQIKRTMYQIAKEKTAYFELLKQELQLKYLKKQNVEELFQKIKNDEWTEYMSLKR